MLDKQPRPNYPKRILSLLLTVFFVVFLMNARPALATGSFQLTHAQLHAIEARLIDKFGFRKGSFIFKILHAFATLSGESAQNLLDSSAGRLSFAPETGQNPSLGKKAKDMSISEIREALDKMSPAEKKQTALKFLSTLELKRTPARIQLASKATEILLQVATSKDVDEMVDGIEAWNRFVKKVDDVKLLEAMAKDPMIQELKKEFTKLATSEI